MEDILEVLPGLAFVAAVIGGILLWRRVFRRESRIVRLELGETADDLRTNKKQYQLALRELRIQYSEASAMGKTVRAVHRGTRLHGSLARSWLGSFSNMLARQRADRGSIGVAKRQIELREQIAMTERIINQIDAFLLQAEQDQKAAKKSGRGSKRRRPR